MLVLIGFGGNRGDALAAFAGAAAGLAREVRVIACSSLWRSAPIGPPQEDFLNAAVLVETRAHPGTLLALCQRLEAAAGRDRGAERRWGPRALDLDLLISPGVVIESPDLVLPHPRLAERRFALAPAAEVAPMWLHPRLHRTLAGLASSLRIVAQRCDRLGEFPAS